MKWELWDTQYRGEGELVVTWYGLPTPTEILEAIGERDIDRCIIREIKTKRLTARNFVIQLGGEYK